MTDPMGTYATVRELYTVKDALLAEMAAMEKRLTARIDDVASRHDAQHATERMGDDAARGDPAKSAAGRAIVARVDGLEGEVRDLVDLVGSHERSQQRMYGAFALATLLGLGNTVALILAQAHP